MTTPSKIENLQELLQVLITDLETREWAARVAWFLQTATTTTQTDDGDHYPHELWRELCHAKKDFDKVAKRIGRISTLWVTVFPPENEPDHDGNDN